MFNLITKYLSLIIGFIFVGFVYLARNWLAFQAGTMKGRTIKTCKGLKSSFQKGVDSQK